RAAARSAGPSTIAAPAALAARAAAPSPRAAQCERRPAASRNAPAHRHPCASPYAGGMVPIGHFLRHQPAMPTAESALPGRDEPIRISGTHQVLGTSMLPPWPDGAQVITVAMGCFWGTERIFWELP